MSGGVEERHEESSGKRVHSETNTNATTHKRTYTIAEQNITSSVQFSSVQSSTSILCREHCVLLTTVKGRISVSVTVNQYGLASSGCSLLACIATLGSLKKKTDERISLPTESSPVRTCYQCERCDSRRLSLMILECKKKNVLWVIDGCVFVLVFVFAVFCWIVCFP
jgi:hypothetical protein